MTNTLKVSVVNSIESHVENVNIFDLSEKRLKIEHLGQTSNPISLMHVSCLKDEVPMTKEEMESLEFDSNFFKSGVKFSPLIDPNQTQQGVFVARNSSSETPVSEIYLNIKQVPSKSKLEFLFYA